MYHVETKGNLNIHSEFGKRVLEAPTNVRLVRPILA